MLNLFFIHDTLAELLKRRHHREEDHKWKTLVFGSHIWQVSDLGRVSNRYVKVGGLALDHFANSKQFKKPPRQASKHKAQGESFQRQETSSRVNLKLCGIVKFALHLRDHIILYSLKDV